MRTRDRRFDGKFFVGVKTTGIYCRPICPARPKRENVEFFTSKFACERAGYRPCLRCRPESAPGSPVWIGKSAVVNRALKILQNAESLDLNEDQFAARFGVTARPLRRLFRDELGKTPKQIAHENRLNLARALIVETRLKLSEIAFASGFQSIRRFNEAFQKRFRRSPRMIRRNPETPGTPLRIRLPYRPPFDYQGILQFYRNHQVGDLDWFEDGKMNRIFAFKNRIGRITISNQESQACLLLDIFFPDISAIPFLVGKVRNLFDLDSDPVLIANHLEFDPEMKALLKKHPGIRLPSGWDAFEVSIATILGQLVSVERARILLSSLIQSLGSDAETSDGHKVKLFPTPGQILSSPLAELKTTGARKRTLIEFSRAVESGEVSLDSAQDVDRFMKSVQKIPGIGAWTASILAIKVLRHTDAFPETDLIISRALRLHPIEIVSKMSPWRSYVAMLLWRVYAEPMKKKNSKPTNAEIR